jgi:hypothetical protein
LRLCRLMCGKAAPYRQLSLKLFSHSFEAAPRTNEKKAKMRLNRKG